MVRGQKLPAALAVVDPYGLEWLAAGMMPGNEGSALDVLPEDDSGFWYMCRRKADLAAPPPREPVLADHYDVDTTIRENARLSGTTTIHFQALVGGQRVLPIHLTDRLRIQEAAMAFGDADTWDAAAVIQEKQDEDSDAALVLPRAPIPGEPVQVRIRYEGKDVLRSRGDGIYAVGARESWYPNLGSFHAPSTFALTYRVPKGNQVVSVGDRTDDRTEGDLEVSVWKTDRPIRVAGFNYGKFRKLEKDDPDSGLKLEVFTNPGTPDIVREINDALQSRRGPPSGTAGPPGQPQDENYWGRAAGLSSLNLDTAAFADGAMADGLNAARVGTAYFGPLPEKHVAITQQAQWFFGQSWPSLVFLPYLAVLDGTQRHELGLTDTADFVDLVGPHELAHQWWGHLVGWHSYRDAWLSEGFAEFTASLVMQRVYGGKRVGEFWDRARRWILDRPRSGTVANADAGPISLGLRLATRPTPAAYQAIVYEKGAYVLQMLRTLLWDPKARPADARFIAMMKDFAASYAGKNPTTADFQAVVERHMTPTMDLTHDRKMDWFFRQWVDGIEIPRYTAKLDVAPAGADQYRISGSLTQEGVSTNFHGFLPVYVEFEKSEVLRLAVVTFTGTETVPIDTTLKLPRKPVRVVANALHDVLTRD
jgi:aminopeptidase N